MPVHDPQHRTKNSLRPLHGELDNWRTAISAILYDRCADSMKKKFGQITTRLGVVWDYDIEDVIHDIGRELVTRPAEEKVFQREVEKARFLLQHGYIPNPDNTRAEQFPKLDTPELQLLWGATISQLAIHPEKMDAWPEADRPESGRDEDAPYRRQFTQNPVLKDYLSEYAYLAGRAGVNPGTTIAWGRSGSWFWFAPANNHVNCDLGFTLLFGLDATAAIVLHEIGHSQHSLSYPPKMNALHEEMSGIMSRSWEAGKFSASDQVRYNYLIHKFHLMQNFHYCIEENPVNFFANTYGEGYGWLMAKDMALREGWLKPNKLGVPLKAEKLDKPDSMKVSETGHEAENAAGNALQERAQLFAGVYHYYNGFFTDSDLTRNAKGPEGRLENAGFTRQEYEFTREILGAEDTQGLDERFDTIYMLSGVQPRGQMRLQPLPNQPSGLLDSPAGKTRADIAKIYCDARNTVIEELWDRYGEELAEKYLSQLPIDAEDIHFDFLKMGLPSDSPSAEGDQAMEAEMELTDSTAQEIKNSGDNTEGPQGHGGGAGNAEEPKLPEETSIPFEKIAARFQHVERQVEDLYRKLLLGQPIAPQPNRGQDEDPTWELPNDPGEIDEDQMMTRWREIKSGLPITRQSYEWQEEPEDPKPQPAKKTKIDVVFLLDSSGSVQGRAFDLGLTAGVLLFRPATKVDGINVYAGLLGNPKPYVIAEPGDSLQKSEREFSKVATSKGLNGDGDKIGSPLSVFIGKIAHNNRTLAARSHHTHIIVASDGWHTDFAEGHEKLASVLAEENAHITIDYLMIGSANPQIVELGKTHPQKMKIRQCENINDIPDNVLALLKERAIEVQKDLTNVNLSARLAALDKLGEKQKVGPRR